MALFNPVYALVIPTLFFITVPLALLASFTTTIAFSILILRVLVVYLDIALSLLPQSLRRSRTTHTRRTSPSLSTSSSSPPTSQSLVRPRRRRPSSVSAGSTTPVSERGLGLIPSVGAERDFEGVGGWRDDDDDEQWTTVGPRLEMPERRHHHRTGSSTATTPGGTGDGAYLMMKSRTRSPTSMVSRTSPNSSRARTPTGPRITFGDGYFPMSTVATSPKATKKLTIQTGA